jgi:hypothetical protein
MKIIATISEWIRLSPYLDTIFCCARNDLDTFDFYPGKQQPDYLGVTEEMFRMDQSLNESGNTIVYGAYLIRFWRETSTDDWRASAQSVLSGEIVRFGSARELFAFLQREMNVDSPVDAWQE